MAALGMNYTQAMVYLSGTNISVDTVLRLKENMTGVGLTVSLWDHLLTIGDEIELVWRQRGTWSVLQTIVMLNRYGGEASMIFIAYGTFRLETRSFT